MLPAGLVLLTCRWPARPLKLAELQCWICISPLASATLSTPTPAHPSCIPSPLPFLCFSKQILRGATFKIRRGEAVGIIGSSGTGKSTTLRLAAGLLQPDKARWEQGLWGSVGGCRGGHVDWLVPSAYSPSRP